MQAPSSSKHPSWIGVCGHPNHSRWSKDLHLLIVFFWMRMEKCTSIHPSFWDGSREWLFFHALQRWWEGNLRFSILFKEDGNDYLAFLLALPSSNKPSFSWSSQSKGEHVSNLREHQIMCCSMLQDGELLIRHIVTQSQFLTRTKNKTLWVINNFHSKSSFFIQDH